MSSEIEVKAGDFTFWIAGCGLDREAAMRLAAMLHYWVDWGRLPTEIEVDYCVGALRGGTFKTTT